DLRAASRASFEKEGGTRGAPVVFSIWSDEPLARLVAEVDGAGLAAVAPETGVAQPDGSLAERLIAWAKIVGGPIFVILDQFEEYFLYHDRAFRRDPFAEELAEAVAVAGSSASFLISLREEELAGLDRFKGVIDRLFANLLRVEHLDRKSA